MESDIADQVASASENGELVDWNDRKMVIEMQDEARQKANELLRYHYYQDEINLINRLYKKGNRDQIERFESMVQCENE